MQIKAKAGHDAWDMERFQFLSFGKQFPSIHPSLQRQSTLNLAFGLHEVIPGICRVRGFDLSNVTFIRGKTGWIVFDPADVYFGRQYKIITERAKIKQRTIRAVGWERFSEEMLGSASTC